MVAVRGDEKSVQSLGDYELEQTWRIGYHTMRTLLGCRNAIEWPTVRLWKGFETSLANYLNQTMREMYSRDMPEMIDFDLFSAIIVDGPGIQSGRVLVDLPSVFCSTKQLKTKGLLPTWFGWTSLHMSHRIAMQTGDVMRIIWPWEKGVNNGTVRAGVLQER